MSAPGDEPMPDPQPAAEHDRQLPAVDREEPPRLAFPVVGVGASAGGLEAFIELFDACPAHPGMAFVLVQHLPPERESSLVDLLQAHCKMPVRAIDEGTVVEIDHVYVIRPGCVVTIHQGKLHLGEALEPRHNNRPVDDFFRSLAQEQRERAIAIILSGMGSNGTAGARMITAVGGMCIAQEPESAKFPSMPLHLVQQGNADFVLRPEAIPEVLARYAHHEYVEQHEATPRSGSGESQQAALAQLLGLVRARTQRDFSGYKQPTVLRRIHRRMGVHGIHSMQAYVELLRRSPDEATALGDDMLIHVTGFFRDPDAWEALRTTVIEPLVASRENGGAIRAWVTACATGEEAYTLAILLDEAARAAGKSFEVKVFATDMAQRALGLARLGVYPDGIETELTPERVARYFVKDDGAYRVNATLRSMVVFAPQNALQDPPFSRLDICSCRNMLIYLEPAVQQRLLDLLHFGLREGGALFLGTSETPGDSEESFVAIDRRWRIYRRTGGTRRGAVSFGRPARYTSTGVELMPQPVSAKLSAGWLIDGHAPASVTVDRDGRILYFHGDTEHYLLQPRGEPSHDLMALVREGLRTAARDALDGAVTRGESVSLPSRLVTVDQPRSRAWVTASPLESAAGGERHYLISFEQRADAPELPPGADPTDAPMLQHELGRMREALQRTVTELQTRNEELRAANEEVTSINEELQSTNEELETSKEELQSLNEELTTVNAQLQTKVQEHEAITNDLSSLLVSTDIAVLFLDRQLRIRRYTPAVRDLFDLIATDTGRPLANLARKFADPVLLEDAASVLERLVPIEREVQSETQRWYLRRVLPYRTSDDRIDGVVLTFTDITRHKESESELAARAHLLDLGADAIVACDLSHRVRFWNRGAVRQFGFTPEEAIGRELGELLDARPRRSAEELVALLEREETVSAEVVHQSKDGRRVASLCRWALDRGSSGRPSTLLLSCTDVTELRRETESLRQGEEQFRLLVDGARDFAMLLLDPDGRITAWNVGAERVLGYREAEAVGEDIGIIFTHEDRTANAPALERAIATRDGRAEDARWHVRKGGTRFFSNGVMNVLRHSDGSVRGYVKILRDDTARKLVDESLKSAAEEAASANRMKDAFLATVSHELRTPLAAIHLWAHVLKKQDPNDHAATMRAVDAIVASAGAQNQLIDDLLDTVRIASGSLRVDLEACDLAPLIHAWADAVRLSAEAKGVHLNVHVDSGVGLIATDPTRLQQVVWNLLKNAVTFTPAGGRVGISVRRRANEVEISVTDTGVGIAGEFLPHVFEKFRQADNSISRTSGGLGLGLAIVSNLVLALGGTVRAESPGLGQGATFLVRMPAGPRRAPPPRRDDTAPREPQSDPLRGVRVLLVEDTADTRDALTVILRTAGAEVLAVDTAVLGYEVFVEKRPDLIVSDIALPGEDGTSLLRRIRAFETLDGTSPVPALAVTALVQEQDRVRVLEAGFDSHLGKPFDPDSLLGILIDLLAEPASRGTSSEPPASD